MSWYSSMGKTSQTLAEAESRGADVADVVFPGS